MWSYLSTLKRNWSQYFISQSSSLIILVVTYAAIILIATGMTTMKSVVEDWAQVKEVAIYLKHGVLGGEIEKIQAEIKKSQWVNESHLVAPVEVAQRLTKKFKSLGANVSIKDVEDFANGYLNVQIKQNSELNSVALKGWLAGLERQFSEIQQIKFGEVWLDRYMGIVQATAALGWFLILILGIAAVIISNSVIKTVLFDRRDEIEVLDFIGADNLQIYVPQLASTFILTLVSYIGGLLLSVSLIFLLNKNLSIHFGLTNIQIVSPILLLALATIALSSSVLSTFITVRRMAPRLRHHAELS